MLRLLNPRKKFREHRSEDGADILIRQGRYTSIFQRRDGYYDVYGDVPSGQNAFLGTYKGLNGAEKALRDNDRYTEAVFRSGRYNPLRRNPVTVKKSEQGREQFWVNEKKWFTSREKADAWLAAHAGDATASSSSAQAAPSTRPARASAPAAAPRPAAVRRADIIEISDPNSAAYSFSPHRANTVMYDGEVFPSVEHAFTAIWKTGDADRKTLKRAHWDKAMDMRLMVTKKEFGNTTKVYRWRMPKDKDVNAELLEIVRDLLRNRQLADMLLATGNKPLSYSPESDRLTISRIESGAIPAKQTGDGRSLKVDGMFLGGRDQMFARALTQVREELRSNVFRRF